MKLANLAEAADAAGLRLRGAFRLEAAEQAGALAGVNALALLGFVGPGEWPAFAASPEAHDGGPDPLDRWSRRVVGGLAEQFVARALFPFQGPPYWPFQAWAMRAELVAPSPLGLLIHPTFGLWHSYRGALAFVRGIEIPEPEPKQVPCATCPAPCLSACPVGAFSTTGYNVSACAGWLKQADGGECMGGGCRARRACPVGEDYRQGEEQLAFHMRAFLAARS